MRATPRYLRPVPDSQDQSEPPRPERRRTGWREFRRAHPGILTTMGLALVGLLGVNGWLLHTRERYAREDARIRQAMSEMERRQADAILARESNRMRRLQLQLQLLRRQAAVDAELHLAVTLDSGVMHFEREGALLRDMPVQVGPERRVGTAPDTVHMAAPRGTRLVERILGPDSAWEVPRWVYGDRGLPDAGERTLKGALGPAAIVLSGGTVIYSMPSVGPLNDSAYVLPGSIRARAEDLRAVLPNLQRGLKVYLY